METYTVDETELADTAHDMSEWDLNLDAPDAIVGEGKHPAIITRATVRYSAAGNPMLNLIYEVDEPGSEWEGMRVFGSFMLTNDQAWRLKAFLKSFSFTGIFNVRDNYQDLENQLVWITVNHKPDFRNPDQLAAQVSFVTSRAETDTNDVPF